MGLAQITDHAARAVSRIVTQFQDSAEVKGFVTVLAAQVQEAENALWSVLVFRDVTNAIGVTLDRIGKMVGTPQRGSLSDAEYRKRVNAQIVSNRSQGRDSDLLQIIALLFPITFEYWCVRDNSINNVTGALKSEHIGAVVIEMHDDGFSQKNNGGPGIASTTAAREFVRYLRDSAAGGIRTILRFRPSSISVDDTFRCAGSHYNGEVSAGLGSGKLMGVVDRP